LKELIYLIMAISLSNQPAQQLTTGLFPRRKLKQVAGIRPFME